MQHQLPTYHPIPTKLALFQLVRASTSGIFGTRGVFGQGMASPPFRSFWEIGSYQWMEGKLTKLHIHHGWWTANPTSPRFSWINISIWLHMNIAKCFIEKWLRHPMTLHGGFHACDVSSQDFSKLMTDLPGWRCSRFGVEYSASQQLRNDLQKRKWKPLTSPKDKAFIGNDILQRPGPCVFAQHDVVFDPLFFFEIINQIPYLQHRCRKNPWIFWQISDGEVDEIPEVLELVRGVSWKTLRWLVGLMTSTPPSLTKIRCYMGVDYLDGAILRVTPFSLWCT